MQYATLREKIHAEKAERAHRYEQFADLWFRAHAAGLDAGNAVRCTPMIVTNGAVKVNGRALDPSKPDAHIVDIVPDGACGFAWVVLYPATSSFARWASKHRGARAEYGGGICLRWVSEFNQSMTRKEAYADAFAKVLCGAGLNAHSRSRMD